MNEKGRVQSDDGLYPDPVKPPKGAKTRQRINAWAEPGFYGVQFHGRQYDLRDHRRHRPLFSVRELGHYCGWHVGNWCIRTGRMKGSAYAETTPASSHSGKE